MGRSGKKVDEWYHPRYHQSAGLVSVPCARPIKPVYIRQFVALIDKLEGAE
jgi:hypothetical protein